MVKRNIRGLGRSSSHIAKLNASGDVKHCSAFHYSLTCKSRNPLIGGDNNYMFRLCLLDALGFTWHARGVGTRRAGLVGRSYIRGSFITFHADRPWRSSTLGRWTAGISCFASAKWPDPTADTCNYSALHATHRHPLVRCKHSCPRPAAPVPTGCFSDARAVCHRPHTLVHASPPQ